MKKIVKIILKTILCVIILFIFLIIILHSFFIILPMRTETMKPFITTNDVVIAMKWFHRNSLRTGDLVVVGISLSESQVLTVRRVEQQSNTPVGQFYLRAIATNGIDSTQLGAFQASNVIGKVVWIAKGVR